MSKPHQLIAPFLSKNHQTQRMMLWTMGLHFFLIAFYAFTYDVSFFIRYFIVIGMGLGLEAGFFLLREGRLRIRSGSSMMTAALLISSIPPTMPLLHIFFALVVGVVIVKLGSSETGLKLNPVLVSRLFLMLAFNSEIVRWTRKGLDLDVVSTATPLELWHQEEALTSVKTLLSGRIFGNWEEMYEMVPGGPGEAFIPVIIVIGLILWWRGILDLSVGFTFLVSFAIMCGILHEPVVFNLSSGAVVFVAVFIAGDPKTTPASRMGRVLAGLIAGVANALIRKYTFYSEGIVYSFLLMNLLSPSLDRMCFWVRARYLLWRQNQWKKEYCSVNS